MSKKSEKKSEKVRCVVTDLAGTVIDYGSCAPAGAFVSLFARHEIPLSFEQARGPMGLHKREHIAELLRISSVAEAWEGYHGKPADDADVDALYAEFIPLQVNCLPDYGELIPGVVETTAKLRDRGIAVTATTGYNRQMLEIVLESAKAGGFEPDAAFCAEDVPHGRPAPWMINRAMEAVNVYPASAVVKIGDTLPDVAAGKNAGCWSVGVTRTGNMLGRLEREIAEIPEDELAAALESAAESLRDAGAHYILESFADLPPLIKEIDKRIAAGEQP